MHTVLLRLCEFCHCCAVFLVASGKREYVVLVTYVTQKKKSRKRVYTPGGINVRTRTSKPQYMTFRIGPHFPLVGQRSLADCHCVLQATQPQSFQGSPVPGSLLTIGTRVAPQPSFPWVLGPELPSSCFHSKYSCVEPSPSPRNPILTK